MYRNNFKNNIQVHLLRFHLCIRNENEDRWKWFFPFSLDSSWRNFSGKLKFLSKWCKLIFLTNKAERHLKQFTEVWLRLGCDWWWPVVLYWLPLRVRSITLLIPVNNSYISFLSLSLWEGAQNHFDFVSDTQIVFLLFFPCSKINWAWGSCSAMLLVVECRGLRLCGSLARHTLKHLPRF